MLPRILSTTAGLMLLASAPPASAENIYCTVVGAKQGAFQSDRTVIRNSPNAIPVLALTQEVTVPSDAASGQATGKRSYKPLTITKLLDASSPQFFEAAVTGEVLRSVACTFYRTMGAGSQAYFKITLSNALVVDVKDAGDGVNGDAVRDERERIEMTFQKIEIEDLDSHIIATDDWQIG